VTVEDDRRVGGLSRSFYWLVVAAALVVALVKRLPLFAEPDFPLGEGGLFVLFSQMILDGGFALPEQVNYGGLALPFAYPPAAFYLAAIASKILAADLLKIYYWLPISLNLLAVPAFCFLAAQLTRDRIVLFCAAILYVQLPDSFIWQITGGGLPRSLGALFALLAVALAVRLSRRRSTLEVLLCGLLVGLCILSHLEWGLFSVAGMTLAVLTGPASPKTKMLLVFGAGLAALIVITPWILAVLAQHGLAPYASSSSASQWSLGAFLGQSLTGRPFGLLLWPAMLGVFVTIARGNWFLVLWTFTTLLLTPRMGISAGLAIPASLLAGYGVKAASAFLQAAIASRAEASRRSSHGLAGDGAAGMILPAAFFVAISSLFLGSPLRAMYHPPQIAAQLDRPSRDAMRWIRERTEPSSQVVVISDSEGWWGDRVAEWFPLLAARRSLTTAQGLEWAGKGVFTAKLAEIAALKAVQQGAPDLMAVFVAQHYCAADYVALFLPASAVERQSFSRSKFYQPLFVNANFTIFRSRGGGPGCSETIGKREAAQPPHPQSDKFPPAGSGKPACSQARGNIPASSRPIGSQSGRKV